MIVVTDYPENLDQVRKRPQGDRPPPAADPGRGDDPPRHAQRRQRAGRRLQRPRRRRLHDAHQHATARSPTPTLPPARQPRRRHVAQRRHRQRLHAAPIAGGLKVGVRHRTTSRCSSPPSKASPTPPSWPTPRSWRSTSRRAKCIVGSEDGYRTTTVTDRDRDRQTRRVPRDRHAADLPPVHRRRRLHPHGDPPRRLQRSVERPTACPFKITTEVTSNVMVKDGHTIVIGGLFRESSDSTPQPDPGPRQPAARRPRCSSNQSDRTIREEVIILLTPHIVKDDAAYAQLSEEELQARRAAARRHPQGHDVVGPRAPGRGATTRAPSRR